MISAVPVMPCSNEHGPAEVPMRAGGGAGPPAAGLVCGG